MYIKNGLIFTEEHGFQKGTLSTKGELIEAVNFTQQDVGSELYHPDEDFLDARDCYVIPGLIDVHFHGCNGYDFSDGTYEALEEIAVYELEHGITGICPTTMTLSPEDLGNICKTAADYAFSNPVFKPLQAQAANSNQIACANRTGADFLGIHLEGPFISKEKKGSQNPDYIQPINTELFFRLQKEANGFIRLITIAPELENSIPFIHQVKGHVSVSLGHTAVHYDKAQEALSAGANHITHLFNAMPAFGHRDCGLIGAAFDAPHCFVELICDGIHVSPTAVRAAFQLFESSRIILVSDSIRAAGMKEGSYSLGGLDVSVKGKTALLADGTIAGSVTNLMDCVKNAVQMGISLEDAIKAASVNPAKSISLYEHMGSLESDKLANLLIMKKDLTIKHIVFHGKVFR